MTIEAVNKQVKATHILLFTEWLKIIFQVIAPAIFFSFFSRAGTSGAPKDIINPSQHFVTFHPPVPNQSVKTPLLCTLESSRQS